MSPVLNKLAVVALAILAIVMVALAAGCFDASKPSTLNPDPQQGGQCRDGNQLSTQCQLWTEPASPKRWCCWPGTLCGTSPGECLAVDPAPPMFRHRGDAGADAR